MVFSADFGLALPWPLVLLQAMCEFFRCKPNNDEALEKMDCLTTAPGKASPGRYEEEGMKMIALKHTRVCDSSKLDECLLKHTRDT